MQAEAARLLASYGRRRGRKLRPGKQELMEGLLPRLTVALPEEGLLDLPALFSPSPAKGKEYSEYWLEIGFGGGEHLAHQALNNPHTGIIGCEPFVNGIAALLAQIRGHSLHNVRIHQQDARPLIAQLPEACLSKVFILYPDPWPKTRHHKRRLVSHTLLDALARVMKPGGELRLATDDEDYGTWMLEQLLPHPAFRWTAKDSAGWLTPWPDWFSTRYEQKALAAGRMPLYLDFQRL